MAALGIVFDAPDNGTGGPQGAKRPIDLDLLQKQTMGDPALETEVLQLFARQARCSVLEMACGDRATIVATAHRLKGAAGAVGALDVSDAAEQLEAMPGDAARMARLHTAVTAAENFILRLCR